MKAALFVLLLLLPACATDRYFTVEEDAKIRAMCEPDPKGCVSMPRSQWMLIEQLLRQIGAI